MSGPDSIIYDGAVSVTPSDSVNLPGSKPWAALYIAGTGTITVTTARGTQVTFEIVQIGFILPVAVTKVLATGTTCTNIVALGAMPYVGSGQ
jgi:hypothetical protein